MTVATGMFFNIKENPDSACQIGKRVFHSGNEKGSYAGFQYASPKFCLAYLPVRINESLLARWTVSYALMDFLTVHVMKLSGPLPV